jgi:hypothetical protein
MVVGLLVDISAEQAAARARMDELAVQVAAAAGELAAQVAHMDDGGGGAVDADDGEPV